MAVPSDRTVLYPLHLVLSKHWQYLEGCQVTTNTLNFVCANIQRLQKFECFQYFQNLQIYERLPAPRMPPPLRRLPEFSWNHYFKCWQDFEGSNHLECCQNLKAATTLKAGMTLKATSSQGGSRLEGKIGSKLSHSSALMRRHDWWGGEGRGLMERSDWWTREGWWVIGDVIGERGWCGRVIRTWCR